MAIIDHSELAGRRILVVEDELLVAMDLEDLLEQHGCIVVATIPTVAGAIAALGECDPELVILDLNLDGQSTLPIAEALRERKIGFVVVSGYGDLRATDPVLRNACLVPKPWNRDWLLECLVKTLPPKTDRI